MRPAQRFTEDFYRFFEEQGGRRRVTCRAESIEAIEKAVRMLGLTEMVRAHLVSAFGVDNLSALSDDNLKRALRFICMMEDQAPPGQLIPLRPGMEAEGRWCLFDGRLAWPAK